MTRAQFGGGSGRRPESPTHSIGERLARRFVMGDPFGFHARPAALFAKTAQQYDADVTVSNENGVSANGKSIMGLLTLTIQYGGVFVVAAQGPDAAEALVSISRLLESTGSQQAADASKRPDLGRAPLPTMASPATERAYAQAEG